MIAPWSEVLARYVANRDVYACLNALVAGAVHDSGAIAGSLLAPGVGIASAGHSVASLASDPPPPDCVVVLVGEGGARLVLEAPTDLARSEAWALAAAAALGLEDRLEEGRSARFTAENAGFELRWLYAVARYVPSLVVVATPERRIWWVNPAVERAWGKSLAELQGTPSNHLWPDPVNPEIVEQMRERAFRDGWARAELAVATSLHPWRWLDVQLVVVRGPTGAVESLLTIADDVTARREAVHDLGEAYRIAGLGGWRYHIGNGDVTLTDAARRLMKVARGTTPSLEQFRARIGDALPSAATLAAIQEGRPFEFQIPWRHDDGARSTFLVRGEAYGPPHQPIEVHGTLIDVTATLAAADERERLQRELELAQRRESVGLLAGGVAHDFNNHLTAILAETALAEGDPAAAPDALRRVESTVRRLRELTSELLALSGRGELRVELFDPDVVVHDTVTLARTTVREKAEITVALDAGTQTVRGDPTQLRQLVLQVVMNAAESVARGGLVHVGTRAVADAWVMRVTDDGPGIPARLRARVFEPFFTTKTGSRGLGLSTAQSIATRLGGTLSLMEGDATTFELRLPTVAAPVQREAERRTAPSRRRVLVIDDDALVRRGMSRLLARLGHDAVEAVDGRTGLDTYDAAPGTWDLVIVDGSMPGLHGLEVLTALRQREPALPVILASGYLHAHDEADTTPGPNAWLPKPFSLSELKEAIQRACGDVGP